jgi:hypothetical protein
MPATDSSAAESYLYEYFVEKKDSAPIPLRRSLSVMAHESKTEAILTNLADEQRRMRDEFSAQLKKLTGVLSRLAPNQDTK